MFVTKLMILALVGALIGWSTNTIAIKMIFRPLRPIKIPILNFKLQGLIPKRRSEIAKTIGAVVEKELISIEEIIDRFIEKNNKAELIDEIKVKIAELVEKNMPPFIPFMFKDKIMEYVNEVIDQEADQIIVELTEKVINKAAVQIKLAEIIEEKINAFELEKLEDIVVSIAKKELKHIEVLGGFIGFLIGIMQGLIVLMP